MDQIITYSVTDKIHTNSVHYNITKNYTNAVDNYYPMDNFIQALYNWPQDRTGLFTVISGPQEVRVFCSCDCQVQFYDPLPSSDHD